MINKIIKEDLEFIVESSQLPWTEFKDKTVFVSGASGFLPAYMIEVLLYLNERNSNQKTRIIGLVRNKTSALARFSDYLRRTDLELVIQDVCSPIHLGKDIKLDYIIHAASQASPKYYGKDPAGTLSANVLGTHNLLNLARIFNVKGFLFFSSGEVYGQINPSQLPTNEGDYGYIDPLNVRSCYAESKRMGETMCVSWAHQYGVPSKIVRPFHTYGPKMRLDDGRVFADFVSDIVNNRNISLKSDGQVTRAFCYLADATLGFFTVLLKGEIGSAYNVGNDKMEISILDLAHVLVNLFPEKKLRVIRSQQDITTGYLQSPITRGCPDITKIRQLGWQPVFSIEEGFNRTVRSFI